MKGYRQHFAKRWQPTASQQPGDADRQRHHQRDDQNKNHRFPIAPEPHGAAPIPRFIRGFSLHHKPAAQDAARLQPLDRDVDAVGAQIIESASLEVLAHRLFWSSWFGPSEISRADDLAKALVGIIAKSSRCPFLQTRPALCP